MNSTQYKYTVKYKKLGKTEVIRVPIHIKDKIIQIIDLLEEKANEQGLRWAEQLLEETIKNLSEAE